MNFKFHRNGENTGKIVKRNISFCEIWSFWSLFSRAPVRTLSLELFHVTYIVLHHCITFIALKKCKGWNMLEIILVQGFCPLKIKTTVLNFLMDSVLICGSFYGFLKQVFYHSFVFL